MSAIPVPITEWSTAGPDQCEELKGLTFGDDSKSRSIAQKLSRIGMLEVQELAQGFSIRSTSFVGTLNLGPMRVTISPKINGMPLFHLLKYAYGLRDLKLYDQTRFDTSVFPFQEILLHQLEAEAQEIISRGIKRDYITINENLSSPKGRLDFTKMAMRGGITHTEIPCRYHFRSEDCLHNQVLLAGLKHGARLSDDIHLRSRLRRKAALLEENVSIISLGLESIRRVTRQSSRLSRAYNPAFEIIKVLLSGQGTSLSSENETIQLPGFLFDMNRFFQRLLVRILSEWIDGYHIEDERVIHGMIDYVSGHNPRNRRSPLPRPDIVVMKGHRVAAILDAKYRDLWETSLPREMLYQLAIYALSGEANNVSTILYPTMNASACDALLEIREPHGAFRGNVVLRPVHLMELAKLVVARETDSIRQSKRDYANKLAFGDEPRS